MYAIVDIGGFQYKVEKDKKYFVSRLNQEEGAQVEFDNVLLVDNEGDVKVGKPTVDGAKVSAKVVSHAKADKKIVFKKKRRTGFRVKKGHRQPVTQIQVEDIVA
ncbi:MAG: 50S ribosomal protein L21 [Bacteroidales bacterium]|jgi:large subunit ribosomal protein L21|nr:50S ribosomal protein L21 [Bacteroidales bacterium]